MPAIRSWQGTEAHRVTGLIERGAALIFRTNTRESYTSCSWFGLKAWPKISCWAICDEGLSVDEEPGDFCLAIWSFAESLQRSRRLSNHSSFASCRRRQRFAGLSHPSTLSWTIWKWIPYLRSGSRNYGTLPTLEHRYHNLQAEKGRVNWWLFSW